MNKKLIIDAMRIANCVILNIVEQTHFKEEFGRDSDSFIASNGFTLTSRGIPFSARGGLDVLNNYRSKRVLAYYPGEKEADADRWIESLRIAVREYNQEFSYVPEATATVPTWQRLQ